MLPPYSTHSHPPHILNMRECNNNDFNWSDWSQGWLQEFYYDSLSVWPTELAGAWTGDGASGWFVERGDRRTRLDREWIWRMLLWGKKRPSPAWVMEWFYVKIDRQTGALWTGAQFPVWLWGGTAHTGDPASRPGAWAQPTKSIYTKQPPVPAKIHTLTHIDRDTQRQTDATQQLQYRTHWWEMLQHYNLVRVPFKVVTKDMLMYF